MDKFKPDYYKTGGTDVIEFCQKQELSFTIGNIIKYVVRAGRKGSETALDDLKKAREYIDREISFMEQSGGKDDFVDIKAAPVEKLEATETEKPLSRLEALWRRESAAGCGNREASEKVFNIARLFCPESVGFADISEGCCHNCAACWTRPYEEAKHD